MTPDELIYHHMQKSIDEFKSSGVRYVHYTSATTFLKILRKKEVWLRHTTLMNDYQEIERGIRAVTNFFGPTNEKGQLFWKFLDECFEGTSAEIKARYDFSLDDLRRNTFVMSLSAHPAHEDEIGRLSMWRAYAPKDGIALVLNPEPFYREENELDVFSYPVFYWNQDEIEERFSCTVDLFLKNKDFLLSLGFKHVINLVFEMLVSYAICLKHPGFAEEKEMRIVYRPIHQPSKVTVKSIEALGSTPQVIHKIPLVDKLGTDLNSILERVILGPSNSILEVRSAVFEVMTEAGISNAASKIFLSDIPLRT